MFTSCRFCLIHRQSVRRNTRTHGNRHRGARFRLATARALFTSAFFAFRVVRGTPIEMYGESRFVDFQVDISIMLHMAGYGAARLGEWRLNHIHSTNSAEVINASLPISSTEIDYRCSLNKLRSMAVPWSNLALAPALLCVK